MWPCWGDFSRVTLLPRMHGCLLHHHSNTQSARNTASGRQQLRLSIKASQGRSVEPSGRSTQPYNWTDVGWASSWTSYRCAVDSGAFLSWSCWRWVLGGSRADVSRAGDRLFRAESRSQWFVIRLTSCLAVCPKKKNTPNYSKGAPDRRQESPWVRDLGWGR